MKMATSGKLSAKFNNADFTLESRWFAISQNVVENYTTVRLEAWIYAGSRISVSARSGEITLDTVPTAISSSVKVNGGNWLKLGEVTRNINHNVDGTKDFGFKASFNIGSVSGLGNVGSATVSGRGDLNTIAKASRLANPPTYSMFNKMPINIARSSSNFTHKAEIYIAGNGRSELVKTITDLTTGISVNMNLAENTLILDVMSGTDSVDTNVILTTYNNGIRVGLSNNYGTISKPPLNQTSWGGDFIAGATMNGVITKGWASDNITTSIDLIFGSETFNIVDKTPEASWSYNTSLIESELYTIAGNQANITGSIKITSYYNNIKINGHYESPIVAHMSNAKPRFNAEGITYKDISVATTNITGNDQAIIQSKSSLQVTIPVESLAIGQMGGVIDRYVATVSGQSVTKAHNGSSVVFNFNPINAPNTQTLTIKAIDNRGLETSVNKAIPIISYAQPSFNVSANRRNNFEEDVTLKASGLISNVVVDNVIKNSIQNISYRYKEVGGTFGAWIDFITQTSGDSFIVTPVDIVLDQSISYVVEFSILDKFGIKVESREVGQGTPIMFVDADKKSVGIRKTPAGLGALEVKGNTHLDGNAIVTDGIQSSINPFNIANDTNLNDIDKAGFYKCITNTQALSILNRPPGSIMAFSLQVEIHAGVKQTFTEYAANNTSKMYIRNYYFETGWSNWRSIPVLGSSSYAELYMTNGWTHMWGGFTEAGYRKDELGYVDLRGAIKGGITTQWTTIGTLPVGYRPNARRSFAVATDVGVATLDILSDGTIAIRSGASATMTSLDGISFYVGDVV